MNGLRGRGRPPGKGLRKPSGVLSANPYTVKNRVNKEKKETWDPIAAARDAARHSDASALSYAKRKLKKTARWINGTPSERVSLEEDTIKKVIAKRVKDGKHATVLCPNTDIPLVDVESSEKDSDWETEYEIIDDFKTASPISIVLVINIKAS